MYQILYIWYPNSLFYTSGGWHGTKIVFFVDMVLGPLLTLILASPNKNKKVLIRDLFFCAAIQICALTYGVTLVFNNKPIALSIHNGSIYTIVQDDIKNLPDKTIFSSYKQKPPLLYSEDASRYDVFKPELRAKAQNMLDFSLKYGVPLHAIPDMFDKIENRLDELKKITTRSLKNIEESHLYSEKQLQRMKQKNWFVIPIDGSFSNGFMAIDKSGYIQDSICCH